MQYNVNTQLPDDFNMYFDAFADIVDNVVPPDEIKEKLLNNLYKWIKEINKPDGPQRSRVIKSAINLLSRHMTLFQDHLYSDCKYWHDIFRSLLLKTTYDDLGQRALKRFYRVIGQILKNQNNEENQVLTVRYYIR